MTKSRRPSIGQKLEAIRTAVRHAFPSADIEQMLEEIERGRVGVDEFGEV